MGWTHNNALSSGDGLAQNLSKMVAYLKIKARLNRGFGGGNVPRSFYKYSTSEFLLNNNSMLTRGEEFLFFKNNRNDSSFNQKFDLNRSF